MRTGLTFTRERTGVLLEEFFALTTMSIKLNCKCVCRWAVRPFCDRHCMRTGAIEHCSMLVTCACGAAHGN